MPKFTKEEVLRYYDVLGLDREDEGLIVPENTINLEYISDLYDINEFERKLSYTYRDVSEAYGILSYMINDEFWYEGEERKEKAITSALEIIDDLTVLDIEDVDEDVTIDRMNNLKATILNGLCSVGDIIDFRLYVQNASFDSIYERVTAMDKEDKENEFLGHDEEKYPESLKTLYYLIAYLKFNNTGSDCQIFDSVGHVSLPNLRRLVNQNLKESVPLNTSHQREGQVDCKILRMSNYRKNNE